MKPPICPLCKVREREYDSEPPLHGGELDYFAHCGTCSALCGYRDHTHTYYPSPVQVEAGTFPAGRSWRTTVTLRPIMDAGVHVGFRCSQFELCGWEQRFTAADMELCPVAHVNNWGFTIPPRYKVLCARTFHHLRERGEIDGPHGWITEHGRKAEQERIDAANWDPGKYIG